MSWRPWYALLIVFVTIVSFFFGQWIAASGNPRSRLLYLISGCAIDLSVLFVFKYFDFFNTQTRDLMGLIGVDYQVPNLNLVVPVAISFHTFQTLSYLFDVYRRDIDSERRFDVFALYVVYYPQLVAGPIERGFHFLPQLRQLAAPNPDVKFSLDEARIVDGLRLALAGFIKKIVIADNLALFVDPVYANPTNFSPLTLALATMAFAYEIYFDFSAYTDIARGCSRVMGIELVENFRRPYLATSVGDFWRRWHISLTSWFRDYVYIPMGGNHVSRTRWTLNIVTVFLLSGLWHGASWTFVIWGGLHGFYYIFGRITQPWRLSFAERIGLARRPALYAIWQASTTFALVCFAWIFFRAANVTVAFEIVGSMCRGVGDAFATIAARLAPTTITYAPEARQYAYAAIKSLQPREVYTIVAIGVFMLWEMWRELQGFAFSKLPLWQRWAVYYAACVIVLLLGNFGSKQFIYFQF
jgi:D-alanyl-lipoteichoic acid acyltransferase DltB (MBOAT superfamily)